MKKRANHEMAFCLKNGIKAYPIKRSGKWYIELDNNGQKKIYDKPISDKTSLSGKDFEKQIQAVYESVYNKILKTENNAGK